MLESLTHAVWLTQIGWLLVHSLWQLALLAVLALTLHRALQRRSASIRYLVLLTALALMVAAPIGTWVSQSPGEGRSVTARFIANISLSSSALIKTAVAEGPAQLSGKRTARPEQGAQSLEFVRNSVASLWTAVQQRIRPWLPEIVALWVLGVLAAAFRPLLSWSRVQQLRSQGTSPVPDAVQKLAARAAERLQLGRAVAVRQSTLASSPVVVGYFRPVVLLPPCVVTDLPPTQLELILAHELCHARRHDYLFNLLQTVVETLFFYHPAVWWLSRQVRIERENCCDDAAMEMAANRAEYGRALLAIEVHLGAPTALSIAAHGGSLLARMRRIAGCETSSRFAPWGGAFSFIAILTFAAVAWAAIAGQPFSEDGVYPMAAPKVAGVFAPRFPFLAVADSQEPLTQGASEVDKSEVTSRASAQPSPRNAAGQSLDMADAVLSLEYMYFDVSHHLELCRELSTSRGESRLQCLSKLRETAPLTNYQSLQVPISNDVGHEVRQAGKLTALAVTITNTVKLVRGYRITARIQTWERIDESPWFERYLFYGQSFEPFEGKRTFLHFHSPDDNPQKRLEVLLVTLQPATSPSPKTTAPSRVGGTQ
jgi:beta-lactamase regulating signal transducer with metallopeptidase domain